MNLWDAPFSVEYPRDQEYEEIRGSLEFYIGDEIDFV